MNKTLRVLNVEDSQGVAQMLCHLLTKAGFTVIDERVDEAAPMKAALESKKWDIILCDYSMPHFDALQALEVLKESALDIPLVIVSGTVGEGVAVEAMRAGAQDYLMKDNLSRLVPVIERELIEANNRREKKDAEAKLRMSELHLRTIVETEPECVKLLGKDGELLEMNPAGLAMIEADSFEEARKLKLAEIVAPPYRKAFLGLMERVFNGESAVLEFEIVGLKGTHRLMETHATPLRNERGEIEALLGITRDVTERKRADEAMRFQAHLLDTVEEAVIATDDRGLVTYWNRFAERLFGWTSEEALGRYIVEVTKPAISRAEAAEIMSELVAGRGVKGEFFMHHRDGTMFPAHVSNSPIFEKGKLVGIFGILFDITERRRTEEKLRNSEQEQRLLAEHLEIERTRLADAQAMAKVGSWDRNLLSGHVSWSDETYRIFEIAQDGSGATFERFLEAVHPEDMEAVNEAYTKSFEKLSAGTLDHRLQMPDGRIKYVRQRWEISHHEDCKAIRILGTCQDITEGKHAENTLRESESLLAAAQRITHLGSWVVDLTGSEDIEKKEVCWSDETYRIFGFEPGQLEISSEMFYNSVHPDDRTRVAKMVVETIEQGQPYNIEHRIILPNGSERTVHGQAELVFDDRTGRPVRLLGTIRDITQQKQAEKEIQENLSLLTSMFEATADGILVVDNGNKIMTYNQQFVDLAHIPDEVIKTRDNARVSAYVTDQLLNADVLTETIKQLNLHPETERCDVLEFKDGRVYESYSHPRSLGGKVVGRVITFHNITERKWAEKELRNSKENFDQLAENITDVFWIRSPDMKKLYYVSPAYERIWGRSVESRYAEPDEWSDVIVPEDRDRVLAVVETLTGDTPSIDIEHRIERPDGEIRWVRVRGFQVRDSDGKLIRLTGIVSDITKRKKAEDEIRAKEERFRAVAETASDSIIIIDEKSNLLYFNQATEKVFGYTPEELSGQKLPMLMPEYLRYLHEKGLEGYIKTGDKHIGWEAAEFKGLHKDGHEIPLEISFSEFFSEGKRHFTGIIRDITERKLTEEAFRASEERLRLLFNQMKDGFYYSTHDGRLIDVNPAMVEMFGYSSRDDMLKVDVTKDLYFSPEDRENHTLDEGQDTSGVYQMRRKDGSAIWVEDRGQYEYDEEGNIVFHQGILRDVTARRLAEEHLIKSEERYRDLVENAHDIIYSHDLAGNFISINKAGELITGYTQDEVPGLNLTQTVVPEHVKKAQEMIAEKLNGEKGSAYELDILAKDGRRIAVEVNTKLIFHDGTPVGVQGIARDITQRKHLEEQLIQAQKLESVGRLAGGIAHDFNNMLTAINGYSDLTLRRMKEDDPLRGNIEEIRKAGQRSALLTNQLLAFSRQQMLMPVVLDINEVITDTIKLLQRLIGEDVQLVTALKPNVGRVKVDPGQLSQIIMNLAVNSRDAMERGGKLTIETANVFLDHEYSKEHIGVLPGAYVMLSVSDTGAGMSAETRQRMFEPFFTTKEVGKGTGLGLATVYGIVKQSAGNILAYSEVGHGTVIKIYLPRVVETAELANIGEPAPELVGGTETILLVEDEEVVRSLSRQILETCGFKVLEAANGVDALALCEQENLKFDLLMTDVVMPQMGGRELAEELRQKMPKLRVLFTSGYTDEAIVQHGHLDMGVNFIQKPFSLNVLAKKIRELLDTPV